MSKMSMLLPLERGSGLGACEMVMPPSAPWPPNTPRHHQQGNHRHDVITPRDGLRISRLRHAMLSVGDWPLERATICLGQAPSNQLARAGGCGCRRFAA